jgi:AcrR family transcriptional regulator
MGAMADSGQPRELRILDAAADLVLRWGTKRVTIEEVAKRAGVGKGTVYLHFESRAWLFMCVLMRESLGLVDELTEALRRDPAVVLPAEQARLTFLAVHRRPLLRAMFSRDSDLLGELANEESVQPLRGWKADLAEDMFGVLREHGLMRTDLDIAAQRHLVGAVQTGFYLYQPWAESPGTDPAAAADQKAVEAAADLLRHAIAAAVQPPGRPDPASLAEVAAVLLAQYQRFRDQLAAAIQARPARATKPA